MRTILTFLISLTLISCKGTTISSPFRKSFSVATTAYTHSESDHLRYKRKTAIDTLLKPGIVAADWSIFPVGTKMKINDQVYEVSDYGSGLVGKDRKGLPIVDIYKPSKSLMRKWGVRFFDNVEIIEWGSYEKSLTYLEDRLKYKHCREMYNNIKKKL